ncbi:MULTISPECIES: mannitol dehydrogenase family protein [unclassified Mesorhizobium]|uniref:mannitol dehydrogenase family protein n=1 Tax=unclassified Mesorhizobium TaxID=325217 RepID=UPI001127E128|nr:MULTISPECIES: mannitol dehydrogenase family protein [unclassified Mesorhizobium]MCA0003709.1 mannitol dehydrogenase family protein [Mesorhizobium sp. B264B2A]MCA0010178.1 mannitol dehydrogenase family protein [Mesorhizobium sp. B264B1B]MCA0020989.1 mannitol dehydrogenase family protein [Mesorhizobium sp. B264B1A]TPJ48842.1 mannitol dehydrogenase family protein [Mesorhizobium sp. B2-6-6]
MSTAAPETLGPALLGRLPATVQSPGYDRALLQAGMAHLGVGAFHRCHQAEYTDDLLARSFGRWGVVGINIRPPALADTLGPQDGLYTRLIRQDSHVEARVIGSIVRVVDSQASAMPALEVLSSPDIEFVTLTVTEKGYCHIPASGALDLDHPDIVHDLANPLTPRSVPGILARALEQRMATHGRPLTLLSCDNIPANGTILENVVRTFAERRGNGLAGWIAPNAAFPSAMVDRIVPASTQADLDGVEQLFGYRDGAVVAGEPFRQWVIEQKFAGRVPRWDLVGATFVDDVTPFEHLKMRVLNGAQTTLSYLGVLAGLEHTFDAMADPLLSAFVRRMLVEETLPTLKPVPGMDPSAYVEQSLGRLQNTAIRHRNHQIATDGSQKIVQRLLNPIRDRLGEEKSIALLSVSVAGWMAYLIQASSRFGRRWPVSDPYAGKIAGIAEASGRDVPVLAAGILAIDAIFDPALAANDMFRKVVTSALDGLLSDDPMATVRHACAQPADERLKQPARSA